MAYMYDQPLDYFVFDISGHLLYTGYSQMGNLWLETLGMDWMLAQTCHEMGVGVKKTAIEQSTTGMGCIARVQYGRILVIGYRSDILIFSMLYKYKDVERRYRKGMMSLSEREIQALALQFSKRQRTSRRGVRVLG